MTSLYSLTAGFITRAAANAVLGLGRADPQLQARIDAQKAERAEALAGRRGMDYRSKGRLVAAEIDNAKRMLAGLEPLLETPSVRSSLKLEQLLKEREDLASFAGTVRELATDGVVTLDRLAAPEALRGGLGAMVDATRPGELTYREMGGMVVVDAEQFTANLDGTGGSRWAVNEADDRMVAVELAGDDDMFEGEADTLANAARLDYKIAFETAGTYTAWVRGRSGVSGDYLSNSVHVGLDGQRASDDGGITLSPGSFAWGSQDHYTGQQVTIEVAEAGFHTLNLWVREDGTEVDALMLNLDAGYTPEGTSMGLSTIETTPGAAGPVTLEDVERMIEEAQADLDERIAAEDVTRDTDYGANPYLQKIIEAQERGLAKIEGMAEREKASAISALEQALPVSRASAGGVPALGLLYSYDLVSLYWQGWGGDIVDNRA
jgi:hypothetical protein